MQSFKLFPSSRFFKTFSIIAIACLAVPIFFILLEKYKNGLERLCNNLFESQYVNIFNIDIFMPLFLLIPLVICALVINFSILDLISNSKKEMNLKTGVIIFTLSCILLATAFGTNMGGVESIDFSNYYGKRNFTIQESTMIFLQFLFGAQSFFNLVFPFGFLIDNSTKKLDTEDDGELSIGDIVK